MKRTKWLVLLFIVTILTAGMMTVLSCDDDDSETSTESGGSGTIYAVGDSVLDFHSWDGASAPEVAGEFAGFDVVNAAESGATVLGEDPEAIPNQYVAGDWSWVIVEGGANDLADFCGCDGCESTLEALISEGGGAGTLVELVENILAEGHRTVLVGYYPVPADAEEFTDCDNEVDVLNGRLSAFADMHDSVIYVDTGQVMDPQNENLYFEDKIHPSIEGSSAIGTLIGEAISAVDLN